MFVIEVLENKTHDILLNSSNVSLISDDWIRVLTAMVKACSHISECPNVNRKRREIALPFRQERKKRGLSRLSVYDSIEAKSAIIRMGKTEPHPLPDGFSFVSMSDDEVRVWYAIGAEIADFSCLGYGIRKYIYAIWLGAEQELKKRNITLEFFCDLQMNS